nr:DUF11 domain-containing protein [Thermoflexales bacterium]
TKPDWLTFTDHGNGTATLTGTPAAADVAETPVVLQVRDAAGLFATQAYTISFAVVDLELKMTASTSVAVVGTTVTYTLVATNIGLVPAPETVLVDDLPPGVEVQAVSWPGCGLAATSVNCPLGTLQARQAVTITIAVRVINSGQANLVNLAAVATTASDPFMANNMASVTLLANPYRICLPLIFK